MADKYSAGVGIKKPLSAPNGTKRTSRPKKVKRETVKKK